MDKSKADEIITDYMGKIFGFALTHMSNTDKAEELASRITCEVYESLLKAGDIHNLNGYVYRISHNVYARFIDEMKRGYAQHISLDAVQLSTPHNFTTNIEREETHARLRREVSYMAGIQREIIVLHYFERLKQYEIAERLQIPIGTVKWHLHDARKQLKERVFMRKTENLALKPIKFDEMGHDGNLGPDWRDTSYYLARQVTQNVAYAAYHQARTMTEIAETTGIPAAFVEDEVAYLEDNGFMDKQPSGKYLTNIFIGEGETPEMAEESHKRGMAYAQIICEKYVPLVVDAVKAFPADKLYIPENDENFFLWLAVTFACLNKLHTPHPNIPDRYNSRYNVKRPDGGEYIALAEIYGDYDWSQLTFDPQKYSACGSMTRGNEAVYAWQLDTYYDSRTGGWQDNLTEDYVDLYEFIKGALPKDVAYADRFKRLYDKGYLVAQGDGDYVNMLTTTLPYSEFTALLPAMPEELMAVSEKLDGEVYQMMKRYYAPHMHDLVRMRFVNSLGRNGICTRVLELLLENGTLKPLTSAQKRAVNTIMFCDTLPK